uniref:Uncharacterized protein n=1 Tax=viral metagenome TaxID=1070528 RepID=A0A6H1ZX00_9ZZZZ
MKTYDNIITKIGTYIRDANFLSTYVAETLDATNSALNTINNVKIGPNQLRVGFEWQRDIQDVLFTADFTGTATTGSTGATLIASAETFETKDVAVGDIVENTTDVSVARVVSIDSETQITTSTLRNGTLNVWTTADEYKIYGKGYGIPTTWNYKFPYFLTTAQDQDLEFHYQTPKEFRRNSDYNYTIKRIGNTEVIQVNYGTTEDLHFEFFSTNMVSASGTKTNVFTDTTDTLLMPDEYWEVVAKLAAGELYGIKKGWGDTERLRLKKEGEDDLIQMCNAIGTLEKKAPRGLSVRSEWGNQLTTLRTND